MRNSVALQLREQTAATHARVESLVGLLEPGFGAERMRAVLGRFAAFWQVAEDGVDRWAAAEPEAAAALAWPKRRRLPLLEADLGLLGGRDGVLPLPRGPFTEPGPREVEVLGWLYVSEGSSLGGAVIERVLRAHPEPMLRELGSFRPYPDGPGPMWRAYLDALEQRVGGDAVKAHAVVAAGRHAFEALEAWLLPLAGTSEVVA